MKTVMFIGAMLISSAVCADDPFQGSDPSMVMSAYGVVDVSVSGQAVLASGNNEAIKTGNDGIVATDVNPEGTSGNMNNTATTYSPSLFENMSNATGPGL